MVWPGAGIAGFVGTAYEQLTNGQPGMSATEGEAAKDSHSILVLQDGTYQPLLRETTLANNGPYGTFDQREELLSRETTSSAEADVQLTNLGFKRTVTKWKAKVKAAKAAAKKKHLKK